MRRRHVILGCMMIGVCLMAGCGQNTEGQEKNESGTPVVTATKAPEEEHLSKDTEESPYIVTFSGKEEVEEAKEGDFVYFKSELYYPVFEGTYGDNLNRFVESVTEQFRDAVAESKETAALDYADALAEQFATMIFPEEERLTISCLWGKDHRQVLFMNRLSDTGGAHPNTFCSAYVLDMTTGVPESIETVLQPYGITKEDVVRYVAEHLRKEYGEELFSYDMEAELETEVARLTEENQWYLTEKGLVVFANPYELAPYAYGSLTCEIPYEVLEEGLKK